jgi:hypothetical protein
MDSKATEFIAKHGASELMELLATTHDNPLRAMIRLVGEADLPKFSKTGKTELELIKEQLDAGIDLLYYVMNKYGEFGQNLDKGFGTVHKANMSKRCEDGLFHRDEVDGKVMKPPGFVAPDLTKVVQDMIANGSWYYDWQPLLVVSDIGKTTVIQHKKANESDSSSNFTSITKPASLAPMSSKASLYDIG